MKLSILTSLLSVALASISANAHGDIHGEELINYRRDYAAAHESLHRRCSGVMRKRRYQSMIRRSGHPSHIRNALLESRNRRDEATNSSSACILTPEVTQGPYHILGELVRDNITSGASGVPLTVEMTFTDVESCDPLTGWWIDVWHANATGFYSGYTGSDLSGAGGSGGGGGGGFGNSTNSSMSAMPSGSGGPASATGSASSAEYTSPTEGADDTGYTTSEPTDGKNFHRGVVQSDSDGVATVYTYFPGWYTGRAVHFHLKAYAEEDGKKASNGSFISSSLSHHTGQIFFNDTIGAALADVAPYSENTLTWSNATKLDEDSWYPYEDSLGYTATAEITYVDASDISKGLVATIDIGINTTYLSPETTQYYWDPNQGSSSSSASSSSVSTSLQSVLSSSATASSSSSSSSSA